MGTSSGSWADQVLVGRVPSYPTSAPPGSLLKQLVMRHRIERGEQPHHPADARDSDDKRGFVGWINQGEANV